MPPLSLGKICRSHRASALPEEQRHCCIAKCCWRITEEVTLSEPTSSPENTCTESALMISPPHRCANSMEAFVFPAAVAPVKTMTFSFLCARAPDELASVQASEVASCLMKSLGY